jgi:hypothetical protein
LLSFEYTCIRKENKHLNLNLIFIIVKYVSIYIISFKRSKYFIRFFSWQTNTFSLQLNSQREITPAKELKKQTLKTFLKKKYIPFSRLPLKIIGLRPSNTLCLSHINKIKVYCRHVYVTIANFEYPLYVHSYLLTLRLPIVGYPRSASCAILICIVTWEES